MSGKKKSVLVLLAVVMIVCVAAFPAAAASVADTDVQTICFADGSYVVIGPAVTSSAGRSARPPGVRLQPGTAVQEVLCGHLPFTVCLSMMGRWPRLLMRPILIRFMMTNGVSNLVMPIALEVRRLEKLHLRVRCLFLRMLLSPLPVPPTGSCPNPLSSHPARKPSLPGRVVLLQTAFVKIFAFFG